MVLSDGHSINGSELVQLLERDLPPDTLLTGGLAGDGIRFKETVLWHNDATSSKKIILCGFYGEDLIIGHGCFGGWDPLGPTRMITHSQRNALHSLDNKPALELYKTYLGKYADDLPGSALHFPLQVHTPNKQPVIRTILTVDNKNNTMTFAGDIPQGSTAQFMKANFTLIIEGAEQAAKLAFAEDTNGSSTGLALVISCVGRRLVLKARADVELEAVADVAGSGWHQTGFYSYGEISPLVENAHCTLQNQSEYALPE